MALPDTGKEDDVSNQNWALILEESVEGAEAANEMKRVINTFVSLFIKPFENRTLKPRAVECRVTLDNEYYFQVSVADNWRGLHVWLCVRDYDDSQSVKEGEIWEMNNGATILSSDYLLLVYSGLPALLASLSKRVPAVRQQIKKFRLIAEAFRLSHRYHL